MIPAKRAIIEPTSFLSSEKINIIEFLGEDLSLVSLVSNQSLLLVSIPNVKNFSVSKYSFTYVQKDFALFINAGTHINQCQ